MTQPLGEREHRHRRTRQALAEVIREHVTSRRLKQVRVARTSGFSRSHLRALLRAEKTASMFLFLELSRGLGLDDPCELLRDVLNRIDALRAAIDK